MAEIEIQRDDIERMFSRFHVVVRDAGGETTHDVTLSSDDFGRYGKRFRSPDEFVRACFEFLLAREPKDSILASFDVSVIARYFPEFEAEITAER